MSEESAYQLRPAIERDREWAYEVKKAALGDYVRRVWGDWDEMWQRDYHARHFTPGPTRIIMHEQTPIGYVVVSAAETCTLLESIHIHPDYQNLGIGTEVIRQVLAEAAVRGLPVRLHVLKVNPAAGLYRRLGFTVLDETETHYIMEHD